ncbi:hypothetical protein MCUN1_002781 [Malassezia cuniculi]|uniref:Wax synthase domain-containing protein n=1 Tax=Malassezia cuniculi TaxID=948313 RepID=A0AAF0EWA5_9BASI|nr:hypothetical protein MCUN1_002781 [Malassezia cuniculi]
MWVLPKDLTVSLLERVPLPHEIVPGLLPSKNPLVSVAQYFGIEVHSYPAGHLDIVQFLAQELDVITCIFVFHVILVALYYTVVRNLGSARTLGTLVICAALLCAGAVYEADYPFVNFTWLAVMFRAALNMWDVSILRTDEEVDDWSIVEFFSHLWALPLERSVLAEREKQGIKVNVRVQAVRRLIIAAAHSLWLCVLLYVIPPYHIFVKLPQVKRSAYMFVMSLAVFHALAGLITLPTEGLALITGCEQAETLKNPFTAVGLRIFWSRWNRMIATVLHRVIFGGRGTHKSVDDRKKEKQAKPNRLVAICKAMLTFLVSGIFHEYLIYFSVKEPIVGINTLFFLYNGVACIASTMLAVSMPKLNKSFPDILKIALMHCFFFTVAELFLPPYIKGGYFTDGQAIFNNLVYARTQNPTNVFISIFGE